MILRLLSAFDRQDAIVLLGLGLLGLILAICLQSKAKM